MHSLAELLSSFSQQLSIDGSFLKCSWLTRWERSADCRSPSGVPPGRRHSALFSGPRLFRMSPTRWKNEHMNEKNTQICPFMWLLLWLQREMCAFKGYYFRLEYFSILLNTQTHPVATSEPSGWKLRSWTPLLWPSWWRISSWTSRSHRRQELS